MRLRPAVDVAFSQFLSGRSRGVLRSLIIGITATLTCRTIATVPNHGGKEFDFRSCLRYVFRQHLMPGEDVIPARTRKGADMDASRFLANSDGRCVSKH
jgi:hypothetical protein